MGLLQGLESTIAEYEGRLSAYREWREINILSSRIGSQRMDLNRSRHQLNELAYEWSQSNCGARTSLT